MRSSSARHDDVHWLARCLRRGQPLLGTLVTLQLEPGFEGDARNQDDAARDMPRLHAAAAAAFAAVAHIGQVMSAHCLTSDLGRLAQIEPDSTTPVTLDPHTINVLRAAQHWQRLSAGAFDPAAAAQVLAVAGLRPAFTQSINSVGKAPGRLGQLRFVGADRVLTDAPLAFDLGGIAKGYAVDLAVETLRSHGVLSGLVNAGGDMRAFGPRRWPVAVLRRGSGAARIHSGPQTLCNAALATSESGWHGSELIATARISSRRPVWGNRIAYGSRRDRDSSEGGSGSERQKAARCCTVQAPDCMRADAMTKWGLQANSRAARVRLARVLRANRATLWRSA